MDKILHIASTFKSVGTEDGSVMIRGMASTNHSDRAGDVITAEAWKKGGLDSFQNNPVILFNHNYDKPIGRATSLKVTDSGLELEAKISKAAKDVCDLVKDGVLGAFSVGFRVKDADYIEETDGLKIKDAELFEVSVVSVPCNQEATFSLAKSFDSLKEYEDFKKTFINSVDLTGQSLTKDESIDSKMVSDAPKQTEKSVEQETKMSEESKTPEIDLEAFAKKVAEETAAKIAMKQAEQKTAEEAEAKAAKLQQEEQAIEQEKVKETIRVSIESGAERLASDMEKEFSKAKEEEISELVKKYEADVAEKSQELEAMRNRKFEFSSNSKEALGRETLEAKILGAITKKGWDTDSGRQVIEKAGLDFGSQTTSANLDTTVSQQFEEEVRLATRVASLFREIPVSSGATVMPFVADVNDATFVGADYDVDTANNRLDTVGGTNGQFDVANRMLNTQRLAAGTFVDNDTDETALVAFIPMITSALARAHGKAVDKALLYGTSGVIAGIAGGNGSDKGTGFQSTAVTVSAQQDGSPAFSSSMLLAGRSGIGKYGFSPSELAYIVSLDAYYDLLEDANFVTVDKAGSDIAANINGALGTVFGSPVVVSDILAPADQGTLACVVNTANFVIPRLRGVNIETDYEVGKQRNVLVASQSFGFKALDATAGAASLIATVNA